MKTKFFKIEVLSNMHVGNGEINYGLIDNLIQRDPITELPNINSSSLKGALREHFRHVGKKKNSWTVDGVFGSDPKDKKNRKQGSVRFFEAEIVAIPVRNDEKPYIMITSEETLKGLENRMKGFNLSITTEKIKELIGNPQVKKHEKFKEKCSDEELPVISRNNLEDGQSANLWYEQVLPKHSVLVFAVMGEEKDASGKENAAFIDFCDELNGAQVQIGANATIGYGYCLITEIE